MLTRSSLYTHKCRRLTKEFACKKCKIYKGYKAPRSQTAKPCLKPNSQFKNKTSGPVRSHSVSHGRTSHAEDKPGSGQEPSIQITSSSVVLSSFQDAVSRDPVARSVAPRGRHVAHNTSCRSSHSNHRVESCGSPKTKELARKCCGKVSSNGCLPDT